MRRFRTHVCTAVLAVGGAVLLGAQTLAAPVAADGSEASYAVSSRDGEVLSYKLSHHRDGHPVDPDRRGEVDEDAAPQDAPPPPACPSSSETPTEAATAETPDPCPPSPGDTEPAPPPSEPPPSEPPPSEPPPSEPPPSEPPPSEPPPSEPPPSEPPPSDPPPNNTPPGPVGSPPVTSTEARFSAPVGPLPAAGPGGRAPLVSMVAGPVVMGASHGIPTRGAQSSSLLAAVVGPPGGAPSYQPSLALDTFLPELPAVAADRNQPMTADSAHRMLGLGGQVDDGQLSLWLVATVSFLILLTVCVASLMDVSGLVRDYLYRRLNP